MKLVATIEEKCIKFTWIDEQLSITSVISLIVSTSFFSSLLSDWTTLFTTVIWILKGSFLIISQLQNIWLSKSQRNSAPISIRPSFLLEALSNFCSGTALSETSVNFRPSIFIKFSSNKGLQIKASTSLHEPSESLELFQSKVDRNSTQTRLA